VSRGKGFSRTSLGRVAFLFGSQRAIPVKEMRCMKVLFRLCRYVSILSMYGASGTTGAWKLGKERIYERVEEGVTPG